MRCFTSNSGRDNSKHNGFETVIRVPRDTSPIAATKTCTVAKVLYHKCPEESNVRTVHAVTVALAETDDLRVVENGISTRRN